MDDRLLEVYIQQLAKNADLTAATLQGVLLQLKANEVKLDQLLKNQQNETTETWKMIAKYAVALAVGLLGAGAGWNGIQWVIQALAGG